MTVSILELTKTQLDKMWFIVILASLVGAIADSEGGAHTKDAEVPQCPNSMNPSMEAMIYQLLLATLSQRLGLPPSSHQPVSRSFLPDQRAEKNFFTTSMMLIERPTTLTETERTILPVWFRNQKIESTITHLRTRVVTETVTSFVTESVVPSRIAESVNEVRKRRDVEEIEPSFVTSEVETTPTDSEFQAAWGRIAENLSTEFVAAEERAAKLTKELLKAVDFQAALKRVEAGVLELVSSELRNGGNNEIVS